MARAEHPSILVIGGGAFGTSTAYHLSLRGYTSVKVLDRFVAPSKDAAATDLNKIIRYDYPNPLYTKLALEAMAVWKSPTSLLSGLFRGTGWILAAHEITKGFIEAAYNSSRKANVDGVRFMTISEIKRAWPEFTGPFKGWTNLWNPGAGWVSTVKPNSKAGLKYD
jgi:sarcosine oxidase/L-pipecolate oxidase